MPPSSIGPYRIVRQLGEGGMGVVYEAVNEAIERRVAIKVLHREYAQDPATASRFFDEARAVNRIEHPSLVQISDYGQTPDGMAYLVMEFLRGESLGQRLDRTRAAGKRLAPGEVARIAWQTADALRAAHEKNVVHRDLKPDNLMLVRDPIAPGGERVKVLDFGIAKLMATKAKRTATNAVMGTPLYMSPEQCRGDILDARSDIYSLGVIAYQMLSGRTPFEGDYKVVMAGHKELPPPRLVAKGVRKKMRWAIESALSKDPEKRPQTALAFSDELRARTDGIFGLLRRSLVIYSEHLPKFLLITAIFQLPVIILTLLQITIGFLRVSNVFSGISANLLLAAVVLMVTVASALCAVFTVGTIVWLVVQYLIMPLRPVKLRPALREIRKNWKRLSLSGIAAAFVPFVSMVAVFGGVFLVVWGLLQIVSMVLGVELYAPIVGLVAASIGSLVSFFFMYASTMLVIPVAMIEGTHFVQSFRRSRQTTKRALATTIAAAMIMMLTPMILAGTVSTIVDLAGKGISPSAVSEPAPTDKPAENNISITASGDQSGVKYSIGRKQAIEINDDKMGAPDRLKRTLLESIFQIIWVPIQIIVLSFSAIIVALLYLKTRLAGGESMDDLLDRFDDDDRPKKKWQQRVRRRRLQSIRPQSEP